MTQPAARPEAVWGQIVAADAPPRHRSRQAGHRQRSPRAGKHRRRRIGLPSVVGPGSRPALRPSAPSSESQLRARVPPAGPLAESEGRRAIRQRAASREARSAAPWRAGGIFARLPFHCAGFGPRRQPRTVAASSVATIRPRIREGVSGVVARIGLGICTTGPASTATTGRSPIVGGTWVARMLRHCCRCFAVRQPAALRAMHSSATSRKVRPSSARTSTARPARSPLLSQFGRDYRIQGRR